jgi:uncharacterized protein YhaN
MYDEARLRRTLQFLADTKRQIIILTCHKRERELLEKLYIPFHAIQLI